MSLHDFDEVMARKLQKRKEEGLYRLLPGSSQGIDFSSNDYLGLARSALLSQKIKELEEVSPGKMWHGSSGSRLLSGNHPLFEVTEEKIARFHEAPASLLYNSGYAANTGLLGAIAGRHDTIFFDEYVHASLRDGIVLSRARNVKFAHNDLADLEKKLEKMALGQNNCFIVVESIYSMDGDMPELKKLSELSQQYGAHLVVDEAHATGVFGKQGRGKVCEEGLAEQVFARVHTFGKALGVHGAAIVGSTTLKEYLVNFSRPFIYTTAMAPAALLAIEAAYDLSAAAENERRQLRRNIDLFLDRTGGEDDPSRRYSPIRTLLVPGNRQVRQAAIHMQKRGFDIRPLMSPTVPEGKERLRICLHSFHSEEEIISLAEALGEVTS